MLNIIKNTINRVFASGVDSDASAFITATGLSGTTQKSAITTLVKDLKSSGLWSKMKAVYPMVTDNYNLLSYTEDFSNAVWGKTNATITANTTTAPNGTLTADSFNDGVANSLHQVYGQINSLPIGTYIFSFYYKSNTSTKNIAIYPFATSTTGGTGTGGVILTQNGTFVANVGSGVVSYGSQDAGNGWRRFYVVGTSTAISTAYPVIAFADGSNITYTGSNTDAYIWGAQFELGSTASTYQPILTTPSAFMASQMKYNLKDARDLDAAFRLTWSGGWTYSATGATPNGTNAYADTKLNDSILTPNSSHLSFYSRTNAFNPAYDIGLFNGTNGIWMGVGYTNGMRAGVFQTGASGELSLPLPNSLGFYVATKNGSTTNTAYKNGANVINGVKPDTTATNTTVYLGALNQNGTPGYGFSTKQIGFATIGNGLSDQDNMLFNQIVEKYQVALSRGVQAAQSFYYNSAYSNEANTYLYSTQITGTTQVSAINTLINGLKANNLWAKMKAVYPFVTDKWNLFGYTEDFGDGSWTKGNSTVTTNSTTAPNGTLTADSLVENTANSTHLVSNTSAITTLADNYTLSIYAKKANRDWININIYNGSTSLFAWFNLNTGTVGTVQSGLTATIQDAGNGWYRCSITRLMSASSNVYIAYNACPSDNTNTYLGNGLVATYIWGAQLEIGSTASVYQPVLGVNNYSTNVAAQMKFNLVNPQDSDAAFRLAFSGGWTYSTNGAQPNGTNGYADTKFIPDNNGLTVNNNSVSIYSRTSTTGPTQLYELGSANLAYTNYIGLFTRRDTDIAAYDSGSFPANRNSFTNTDGSGYYIGKVNSDLTSKVYKNAVLKASKTIVNQALLSAFNVYIGGFNENNTTTFYSGKQLAFAHIGTGLSDAEVAILNQLVTDYETTLNRNV